MMSVFCRTAFKAGRNSRACGLILRFQSSASVNLLDRSKLPYRYSDSGPVAVKYTVQHEWIAAHKDGTAFVGITKYAADALGDATYVELPELDCKLETGDVMGSVESVKSASEVYMPASGVVVEVNEALNELPQLINQDPMGTGWICKLRLDDAMQLESEELLSLDEYERSLEQDE